MPVDLHVHTNASDGTESPRQVVYRAGKVGLQAIAITDHDTLNGIIPALEAGRAVPLEVLPGIELSTEYMDEEVHLLGYLMDLNHGCFLAHLIHLRQDRKERAIKMVNKLRQMGIPITSEQVFSVAGGGAVGRPHVARVLIEMGFVQSIAQAFELYIGRGGPAYVSRFKYSPVQAVRMIRQAGGVPVLAHPGSGNSDALIPQLVDEGLQGLEVYYPGHSSQVVEHYLEFCRYYNLLFTGGSDYHGPEHKNHGSLGTVTVPYSVVQGLKARAKER